MINQHLPFVSYNSKEKQQVAEIVTRLEQAGIPVWFDDNGLLPGSKFGEKLAAGISVAFLVVLFIGKDGYGKYQCQEILMARQFGCQIIPVFLPSKKDPTFPEFLRKYVSQFSFLALNDDGRSFEKLCIAIKSFARPQTVIDGDAVVRLPSKEFRPRRNFATVAVKILTFAVLACTAPVGQIVSSFFKAPERVADTQPTDGPKPQLPGICEGSRRPPETDHFSKPLVPEAPKPSKLPSAPLNEDAIINEDAITKSQKRDVKPDTVVPRRHHQPTPPLKVPNEGYVMW